MRTVAVTTARTNTSEHRVCGLDSVRSGMSFRIHRIDDEMARITAIRFGMAEGAVVSCVTRIPAGPVIVKSGRQEIAIGRSLARSITVQPVSRDSADVG